MPAKHVRFSGQTTLYSPPTSVSYIPPPLTYSFSTASTSSLPTPPAFPHPLPQAIDHYSHPVPRSHPKAYPRPHRSTMHLHQLLQYSPEPQLVFDLRDSPAAIKARGHHIPGQLFSEPATSPPTSYMRIRSPHLPWLLRVIPTGYSQGSKSRFVTVADVLGALYNGLRTNTSPEEYALLKERKEQKRAYQAYQDRYRRCQDRSRYQEEKQGGIKRVDFLMGRVKFLGLAPGRPEEGEWLLQSKG